MSSPQTSIPRILPPSVVSSRAYLLVVLTLVYVVNYLDRQIINILLPYIQQDFELSDFQGGLLTGTAFAAMYATLGVPISMLADRLNRRNLIAASLATFSLMTVLSGLASRYWQLLLARFGTGIGEAGTGPAINSVIADLYPPERRAGALAFYAAGLNVGLLIGFFGGGWILQHYGWRSAFIASGLPGLLLASVLLLTMREPARGFSDKIADDLPAPRLMATVHHLLSLPSVIWMTLGCTLSAFGGYAGLAFIPKFLIVSHHLSPVQIGTVLAVMIGIFGAVGTYGAGAVADRLGRRDGRWYMYVPLLTTAAAIPFVPVLYLSSRTTVVLAALIAPSLAGATYLGPCYAMAQAMVPLRMRAQTVGLILFVLNIIALGGGPASVGLISDVLKPRFGSDSLRYALLTTMLTGAASAFCFWRASLSLSRDLTQNCGESSAD